MPILPLPKCRAELYLMPIEATVPVGDKKITGRTTRLDLGASEAQVDRNSMGHALTPVVGRRHAVHRA